VVQNPRLLPRKDLVDIADPISGGSHLIPPDKRRRGGIVLDLSSLGESIDAAHRAQFI
jgi:hypothetical protein